MSSAIEAGRAYVELFTKDAKLIQGLRSAQRRLDSWGASATAAGAKLAGLGAAMAAPFLGAAKLFADSGSALLEMSQRTGASVESLSELQFAAQQAGVDMATLETGIRKLQVATVKGAEGSDQAQEALADLGLTAERLMGLSPDKQLELVAEGMSRIADPAKKAAAAVALFGRSGTALLPLMTDGSKGIAALRKQAQALGITMSTEDAKAADTLGDAIDATTAAAKRTIVAVGAGLAPVLTNLADWLSRAAASATAFVAQNRGLIVAAAMVAAGLVAAGAGMMTFGIATKTASAALGLALGLWQALGAAIVFLTTPIGMVIAALAGLGAWFVTSTQTGAAALGWLRDVAGELVDDLGTIFGGIADALAAGDIALAAKILWAGVRLEFGRGIAYVSGLWASFKGFFLQTWATAVYGLAGLFFDAWAGIQTAWIQGVDFFRDIWSAFTGWVMKAWNTVTSFFRQAWANFLSWFSDEAAAALEARTEQINADAKAEAKRIDEERDATIYGREQARRQALEAVEAERAGARKALGQMADAEEAARQKAADEKASELAAEQAGLLEERKRLQELAAQAKTARAAKAGPKGAAGPEFKAPDLDALAAMNAKAEKFATSGTFSGAAISGLGAGSAEETAKNTREAAGTLKRIERKVEQPGIPIEV